MAATLVALALQTVIPYWLPVGVLVPDLVLILAVDLGLRHHVAMAALLAFAIGYATDAFSGTQIGPNAFMITVVFLFAFEISSRLLVTNMLVGLAAVFAGVLIKDFGVLAISSGIAGVERNSAMIRDFLLQALITAALAPFVFAMLAKGKRLLGLPAASGREDNRRVVGVFR
ncbi:MAG: rod shape-determining protein MreD [Candidatus Binataceae bacterium]